MGELGELVKKNPALVFFAIAVVVVLAYMSRNNSAGASGDVSFSGGGERAPSLDPNVASVMEAQTSSATAEFQSLTGLVSGAHTTDAELEAEVAAINSQTTLGLAQTAASVEASRITSTTQQYIADAQVRAEQAAIAAQEKVALTQSQNQKDIARANDNTNIVGKVIDVGVQLLKFL